MKLDPSDNLLHNEMSLLLERDKMRLTNAWTKDCKTEEERIKCAQTLANSGYQFDKLRGILKDMYREAQRNEEERMGKGDDYVYATAYKKAIRDIYSLIPKTTKE